MNRMERTGSTGPEGKAEMSDDLIHFLRAQLDEDERIARRACEYAEAEWRLDEDGETILWWPPEPLIAEREREHGLTVVSDRWRGQTIASGGERIAPHIAEYDPARVLREIDAKRRITQCHEPWKASNGDTICGRCGREHIDGRAGGHFPCQTLRLLALPYADRPGYREEWRP